VLIEGRKFFEQYETTFRTLKQAADGYLKSGASGKTHLTLIHFPLRLEIRAAFYNHSLAAILDSSRQNEPLAL